MEIRGDFTGFTFDGVHSSELGIVRVSDGDRYSENLFGEMKDRTTEVNGVDGEYYFGSNFGNSSIKLSIAYDSVTEEQFRKIRQVFGQKKVCELVFDERPYKKYLVKVTSPIELSYVCFDEPLKVGQETGRGVRRIEKDGERIWEPIVKDIYDYSKTQRTYKGEGSIELTAFYPFAKSIQQFLKNEEIGNQLDSEWAFSSGLLTEEDYSVYNVYNNGQARKIYNPGDMPTGVLIYCPKEDKHKNNLLENGLKIEYSPRKEEEEKKEISSLIIDPITEFKDKDIGILIDTNVGLIYGVTKFEVDSDGAPPTYNLNESIYNLYVSGGYFFKIQPTKFEQRVVDDARKNVPIEDATLTIDNDNENIIVYYDYLYM